MNRKALAFLTLLPIALFVICMVIGSVVDIYAMRMAAVVILFGGEFCVAVGYTVFIFIGIKQGKTQSNGELADDGADTDDEMEADGESDEDESDDGNEEYENEEKESENVAAECAAVEQHRDAEAESEALARINSTYGVENQTAMAEHQIAHVKSAYRSSSKKEKIAGFVLLGVLLALFLGFPIFIGLGYIVAGIVCFAGFGGIIIISGITVAIRQKISMSSKGYKNSILKKGKVLACTMSSLTGYSAGRKTNRITIVMYKVRIEVDGEEKTAYGKTFYEVGDEVEVLCNGKWKNFATIVTRPEKSGETASEVPERDENEAQK